MPRTYLTNYLLRHPFFTQGKQSYPSANPVWLALWFLVSGGSMRKPRTQTSSFCVTRTATACSCVKLLPRVSAPAPVRASSTVECVKQNRTSGSGRRMTFLRKIFTESNHHPTFRSALFLGEDMPFVYMDLPGACCPLESHGFSSS